MPDLICYLKQPCPSHSTIMTTNRAKVVLPEFTFRTLERELKDKEKARVFFSRQSLESLGLDSGSLCYLRKANGEESGGEKRIAIAWLENKPVKLSKTQLQMGLEFAKACGFVVEDRLVVEAIGSPEVAKQVVLMQLEGGGPMLGRDDKDLWKTQLESRLSK